MQITGEPMPNFFLVLDLVFFKPPFRPGVAGYFLFIISPSPNPWQGMAAMAASMMDYT